MGSPQDLQKDDEKTVAATSGPLEMQQSQMDDDNLKTARSNIQGDIKDLDEAGLFLQQHNFSGDYLAELLEDTAMNKRVIRKVDLLLMPLLCGTYFLQYIDKQAVSYSAVFDLFETTGITGSQYSWLGSIFYFAYFFAEWPSAYLAQHFPTGRVIACYCFMWGTVMLCTAATHNFAGFAAMRFLLGVFESVVTPAFMMIVGQYYLKYQQPARAGMFYCFNGVGSATGGIIFYGVGYAKNFPVWKIIYLICGGLTVLWAIVLFFRLPNDIMSWKKFTPEERALLIARAAKNRTGVLNRKIKVSQIREALTDPQIWILFFFTLLNEIINGGIATLASSLSSLWLAVMWVFTGPFLASRIKNARTYIMALWLCPTIIGTTLIWKLPRTNLGGGLAGYYMVGSFVGALVIALQFPASNVAGYTKRTTSTAFVFLAYCIGNIIGTSPKPQTAQFFLTNYSLIDTPLPGPQAFLAREAPIYETGVKTVLACSVGQCILALVLRALLVYRNKKRDREEAENPSPPDDGSEVLEDLTDFQNRKFRYSL
ncbi:putative transporter [Cyphellophora attinorum]|uniref:Putative transporter n=1 Tax=Cyphellophora attinorum TaxID=1664694 RepID=A0A0N0NKD9_9EURO|nr:putative transporter [Phialophora attinorum]KPI38031.1 putative transporter [Phialophora attinorum]